MDIGSHTLTFSHGAVTLNDEQNRVATSPTTENQRILASAGSGKTTTITARIAYLLEHYDIPPKAILLVTFSRSAANEMKERLHRLVGQQAIYAGTFHALSAQILKEQSPASIKDQPFVDELPYRLVEWLQTEKGRKWAVHFKCIIVDEFQDINPVQWKLLQLLHHRWATMTIVGDDAQNIYTWRGSSVDFILNFHKHVKSVKDYQLCRNYRSTAAIVTAANSVMRFIPTLPYKQKMVANHTHVSNQKPAVHFFYRGSDEYDWIVNQIELAYRENTKQTFAIISRYNHDLFKIEERLHRRGIIYMLCTKFDPERQKTHFRRITLTTIHASKGLEWDTVYFMNLHDDVFPSRKTDEDIISERRLFYVGITRARAELIMTYSKQERALSRFVREIPRPFLTYHNITAFQNSTYEGSQQTLSISDMIAGFDGDDWHKLRAAGNVPTFPQPTKEQIYGFGQLFTTPEFVKSLDIRETWLVLIAWMFRRECAKVLGTMESLRTEEVNETLLTLRIYKEDIAFWLEFETEMEHLVYHFLSHTTQMPPVEYADLEAYVTEKMPHLTWTTQQLVQAVVIIAKIRGQLRPLRHGGFDLKEFRFANVRNSVPTELRPFVLKSWHTATNPALKTDRILPDLWRLASLKSVIEGRNIPLYQYHDVSPHLESDDMQVIAKAMASSVKHWLLLESSPTLCVRHEVANTVPIFFDIVTENTVYQLYFDGVREPSADEKIILLLKIYVYCLDIATTITTMGFINMATGIVYKYAITEGNLVNAAAIWEHAMRKY